MFISFSTDIDVVHIRCLFLISSNRNGRSDGRLRYLLNFNTPLILWLLKIAQSELRLPIRNYHINSIMAQNSMDLRDHFICISIRIFPTLDNLNHTKTESKVALSTIASKDASGKSIDLTSICKYLKVSPFSLYFSFIAFIQTFEISIFVIFLYPSSYIYSLRREFPAPTFRILLDLSICVVMISLRLLKRWYQSNGSGSLD